MWLTQGSTAQRNARGSGTYTIILVERSDGGSSPRHLVVVQSWIRWSFGPDPHIRKFFAAVAAVNAWYGDFATIEDLGQYELYVTIMFCVR
jgi:hypothetical protein